jgi:hypothetical protein
MVLVELIYLVVVPCPVPNIFLRLQTPYLQRIKSSRTCCSPQAAQGLVMDCWSTLLDLLEKRQCHARGWTAGCICLRQADKFISIYFLHLFSVFRK